MRSEVKVDGAGRVFPRRREMKGVTANQGFTLVEMIATMAIMMILAGAAIPIARVHAQRTREIELHRSLREIRDAIDRYKDLSDRGMIPTDANTYGYPKDLDTLVNGVVLKGASTTKYKFLRRLPVDPMTNKATWGERSMQDDPDAKSWGGENVFDVYSLSPGIALDNTQYSDW
jgi:general secretion pathway protein G